MDGSICYRIDEDESSYTSPKKYYVDFNSTSHIRDGSHANPFVNLLEVYEYNIDHIMEITFKSGIHKIDYFLPEALIDISVTFRSDPENHATLIIKNDFGFVTLRTLEIFIFNIIIETEGLSDPCEYTLVTIDMMHSEGCQKNDYNTFHSLFDLNSHANLYITNTTFQNIDAN